MSARGNAHIAQCHRRQPECCAGGTPIALSASGLSPFDVIGRESTVFPAGAMEQIRDCPCGSQDPKPLIGTTVNAWRNLLEPTWIAGEDLEVFCLEQRMVGFDADRGVLHKLRRPARATQRLDAQEHGGRHGHDHVPVPVRVAIGKQIGINVAVPAETLHQAASLPQAQVLRRGLRRPTEPSRQIASTKQRGKITQTLECGDLGLGSGSRSHDEDLKARRATAPRNELTAEMGLQCP